MSVFFGINHFTFSCVAINIDIQTRNNYQGHYTDYYYAVGSDSGRLLYIPSVVWCNTLCGVVCCVWCGVLYGVVYCMVWCGVLYGVAYCMVWCTV